MADRYWVGGADTWNATAGSKWAATSGGAGGESAPTSSDDVYIDANSGAVTVTASGAVCKNLNFTGFTGTFTGSPPTTHGGLTLVAGMTLTVSGIWSFVGTGTIISAGKTIPVTFEVDTAGTITLGDALTISAGSNLNVRQGTFDSAGYSITATSINSSTGLTRQINLGASTVSLNGITNPVNFGNPSTLTFNAGTSQINLTGDYPSFNGQGKTFYNVTFTSTNSFSNPGTRTISGENVFNNLTSAGPTTIRRINYLRINNNQTVNGTFDISGTGVLSRQFVFTSATGSSVTLNVNSLVANHTDFQDITIAGSATGSSPTGAGNCGGNSGITFPVSKTVYWSLTGVQPWYATAWATTSGGLPNDANFPLAQDVAVIDNSSGSATVSTSFGFPLPNLDASTFTSSFTINLTSTWYGNFVLGTGITISGPLTLNGRGSRTLTSAGKTFNGLLTIDNPGGSYTLGDAFSSSAGITLTSGTFNANNYNVTCTTFGSDNANTRAITMGSGLWTLSGTGSVWNTATTTGLTFTKNTANITLTNTSSTARTFASGGLAFNKLTIGGATGTSTTTITGSASFTELASTKTVAHTITLGADLGTIGTWSVNGTLGNVVTLNSSSAGVRRNFSLTNSTENLLDFLSITDIGVNEPNRFYVGFNSTNGGNNNNVLFFSTPSLLVQGFLALL
jgi:hypothetical protein